MKRKNGFTLIELVVVIALIAILAVTLAPRLRDQIAKAGDSKAIAVLGALRTQSEVYFADNQVPVGGVAVATADGTALSLLIVDLDNSSKKLFDEGEGSSSDGTWATGEETVPVGGTRPGVGGTLTYGGVAGFDFGTDNIEIVFGTITNGAGTEESGTPADTKDRAWEEY